MKPGSPSKGPQRVSMHELFWYCLTPLSPTPSSSSPIKTPDPQCPGHSVSLVERAETPKKHGEGL